MRQKLDNKTRANFPLDKLGASVKTLNWLTKWAEVAHLGGLALVFAV